MNNRQVKSKVTCGLQHAKRANEFDVRETIELHRNAIHSVMKLNRVTKKRFSCVKQRVKIFVSVLASKKAGQVTIPIDRLLNVRNYMKHNNESGILVTPNDAKGFRAQDNERLLTSSSCILLNESVHFICRFGLVSCP